MIKELTPDIAILDISMPKMTGIDVVRRIKKVNDTVQFIIFTMHTEEEFLYEALDAGVKGYILKENTTDELLEALKAISVGGYYVSPLVSGSLIKRWENKRRFSNANPSIKNLTVAEVKVLKLLSNNKTSKEIAENLNISFRTVQNKRGEICKKLGLQGANSLLQFAIEHKSAL